MSLNREKPLAVTRQQRELLPSLPWPGNVRELRNVMERAIILSKGADVVWTLPCQAGAATPQPAADVSIGSSEFLTDLEFQQREKQNLVAALEHAGVENLLFGRPVDLLYSA